jgi:crotonobetainyl-CoA:carnitine CoA-transferase CaiB-like acyl-CoA transferase
VTADPHLATRNMLVELARTDGVEGPVLVPGNPVKLSKVPEAAEERVPWLGEHTAEVLRQELELTDADIAALGEAGTIGN